MTLFADLVNELWDENGGDAYKVAVAIATKLKLTLKAREVLLPVIANRAQHDYRGGVRSVERRVSAGSTTPEDRDTFLEESFPIPGELSVTWGEATLEHHNKRVAWLERQVAGLYSTIDRHCKAASTIHAHGVSCLNDLPIDVVLKALEMTP